MTKLNLKAGILPASFPPIVSDPVPLMEARDLTIVAADSGKLLVEGVSLSLHAGEVLALVGESGSGKSLTALALIGLLPSSVKLLSGTVLVDGVDVTGLEGRHSSLRGSTIAAIFQDPQSSLDPRWTVERYLVGQFMRLRGFDRTGAGKAAREILEQVGLSNGERILRAYPHQLSGGMAQRVMIAGALAGAPRILIADEPTTALDATTQAQILDLIDGLRQHSRLGVLMITHDLGVVAQTSDRMMVLYGGQMMESGHTDAVLAHPGHPYTSALLAAMPDIASDEPPVPIAGTPGRPDGSVGCSFQPRCQHAFDRCRTNVAPRQQWHVDGALACHAIVPPLRPSQPVITELVREFSHALD